jgi:hypothetical protein
MALWLVRVGRYREYEKKLLEEGRIYLRLDVARTDHPQGVSSAVARGCPPLAL